MQNIKTLRLGFTCRQHGFYLAFDTHEQICVSFHSFSQATHYRFIIIAELSDRCCGVLSIIKRMKCYKIDVFSLLKNNLIMRKHNLFLNF